MKKKIIYLKELNNYDEVLKKEYNRIPLFIKKIIFILKNMFNIVTKKNIEGYNIWVLPIREKYRDDKIRNIIRKKLKIDNNTYVISKELSNSNICKIMNEYSLEYITEEKAKKVLIIPVLQYISKLQKKDINSLDISILINDNSEINLLLIEEISKIVKSIKIVSLNIYKFRKLEEKLYNDEGIAIQFSNSYKKSLEKSNIIINFNFNEIEINEYNIYNNAIIINCYKDNIKIKSRLFEGIVINSYDITLDKELMQKFKDINIYYNYKNIILYATLLEKDKNIIISYKNNDEECVRIKNLIGNNGVINKKEFKNMLKKLDKNIKKE